MWDSETSVEDRDEFDDKWEKLVRCCGQQRPPDPDTVEVLPSTQPFVTFRDYVTTVHAWIMSHRADILAAMNAIEEPFPPLLRGD